MTRAHLACLPPLSLALKVIQALARRPSPSSEPARIRARSRGRVDVCGVVIGGSAVLHALGAPTPA